MQFQNLPFAENYDGWWTVWAPGIRGLWAELSGEHGGSGRRAAVRFPGNEKSKKESDTEAPGFA